jgi:hypothetical protein
MSFRKCREIHAADKLMLILLTHSSFVGTIVLMTVVNKDTATKAGLLFSYYM